MSYKGNKKGSYGYNNQRRGQSGFHSYGKGKKQNDTDKFEDSKSPENQSSQEPETDE